MSSNGVPVKTALARSTGTRVSVWRTVDWSPPANPGNGKWITVCQHGHSIQSRTRTDALGWSAMPEQWCSSCAFQGRQKHYRTGA